MVSPVYHADLNKVNTSAPEVSFLDLHFPIFNDFISAKMYDKSDDF